MEAAEAWGAPAKAAKACGARALSSGPRREGGARRRSGQGREGLGFEGAQLDASEGGLGRYGDPFKSAGGLLSSRVRERDTVDATDHRWKAE